LTNFTKTNGPKVYLLIHRWNKPLLKSLKRESPSKAFSLFDDVKTPSQINEQKSVHQLELAGAWL
jgi:hypothetical protein